MKRCTVKIVLYIFNTENIFTEPKVPFKREHHSTRPKGKNYSVKIQDYTHNYLCKMFSVIPGTQ